MSIEAVQTAEVQVENVAGTYLKLVRFKRFQYFVSRLVQTAVCVRQIVPCCVAVSAMIWALI